MTRGDDQSPGRGTTRPDRTLSCNGSITHPYHFAKYVFTALLISSLWTPSLSRMTPIAATRNLIPTEQVPEERILTLPRGG